ncbi:MAG: protein TolR [Pseudomonadota bacterium]|nr:protein TolR [Pseudomonadota bacterium]
MKPSTYTPGKGQRQRYQPMAEINVTPFVDVMLVLLVVFMVTAPLLTVGVKVDLPQAEAEVIQGNDEPLTVSINDLGQIFVQEAPVEGHELVPRLKAITGENADIRIFVRGDERVNYGLVMELMSSINVAGFSKVALITKMPLAKGSEGQ